MSRVPYAPSPEKNGSLPGDNGGLPLLATGLRTQLRTQSMPAFNRDTYKVAVERVPDLDAGQTLVVGPERITCVLRDVGTFDAQDPLERKSDGARAQGALGFNPPSLLGLATSAPYLHHGAARTLEDLFTPRFEKHALAGNAAFAPDQAQVADLIAFLESIDEHTVPFAIAAAADICDGY